MITFAELDENLNVKRSIVISEANNADENGDQDESVGISFCKKLYGENTIWKQAIGKRGETHFGQTYYEEFDLFIDPQPYSSWTLSSIGEWIPPIEKPTLTEEQIEQTYYYYWDEEAHEANSSEGWVLFVPQIVSITEEPNDVTVSVGSSAVIGVGVTLTNGNVAFAAVQRYKLVDSESETELYDWIYDHDVISSFDGNSAYTGILTTSDYTGDYRLVFYPDGSGKVGVTTSFTLTVN